MCLDPDLELRESVESSKKEKVTFKGSLPGRKVGTERVKNRHRRGL